MKIAVLAWGSLFWNPGDLRIADKFEPTGPRLPIEFCRISSDGRLTLVIDEANGAECIVDVVHRKSSVISVKRHPKSTEKIRVWAISSGYDAVIWTALGRKFKDAVAVAFSVDAALNYLKALDSPSLSKALEYVRLAPPEVQTPVREAVNRSWPST